jgi:hypothetical protein
MGSGDGGYFITQPGYFPTTIAPYGINDQGEIAGIADLTNEQYQSTPRTDERFNIGAPHGSTLEQAMINYSPLFHALSGWEDGTYRYNASPFDGANLTPEQQQWQNVYAGTTFGLESVPPPGGLPSGQAGNFSTDAAGVIKGIANGGGEAGQAALDAFRSTPLTEVEMGEGLETRRLMEWILASAGYGPEGSVDPAIYATLGQWSNPEGAVGPPNFAGPDGRANALQYVQDQSTLGQGNAFAADRVLNYQAPVGGTTPHKQEDDAILGRDPSQTGETPGGYNYGHDDLGRATDKSTNYFSPSGGDPLNDAANYLSQHRQQAFGADRAPGDKSRGPTAGATTRANDIVASKRRRSRLVAAGAAGRVNRPSPLASGSSQGLLAEDVSAVGGALGSPSRRTL